LSAFQAARFHVWWDEELGGGELWWRGILEQIRGCDVFIFALSQNSLDSKHCLTEYRYAKAVDKRLLPVQIGGAKSNSMRESPFAAMNVIDYRVPSENTAIRLIEDARQTRRKPLPDPLPPEPPRPYEFFMEMKEEISGRQLIPTHQLQVLFKLKERLKEEAGDSAARADIADLLYNLRNRPDMTPEIRAECDAELKSLNFKPPGDRGLTRRRVLAGAALLLAVVVALVVWSVVSPGRQVTPARLQDVLLTDKEIDTVMGTDMSGGAITNKTGDNLPEFKPPECVGTLYNGNIAVYKDTGYSETRIQPFRHPAHGPRDAYVWQSVFLFPWPTKATELVGATAEKWKETCLRRTATPPDGSTWTFDRIESQGLQLLVDATMLQGGELPFACQKVMRAEGKVGIEVLVCRNALKRNEAVDIAEKMAGKVTDLTAWPRRWFP
jgi:hypothetical protein